MKLVSEVAMPYGREKGSRGDKIDGGTLGGGGSVWHKLADALIHVVARGAQGLGL